jgi:glycosyltransferase involved in cell wall biosynthesis
MRILRVVHRLYPPKVGGLSYYAHLLSVAQARAGHEVVVLSTREGGYPEHEFRDGYEIYRHEALAWPWENPITIGVLGNLLSRSDGSFDILDAHSHLMFTTNLAAFKRHLSVNPLVITNHGFRVKRSVSLDFAQDIYLSSLGRWTLRAADYVVSLTESERRKTVSAGVPSEKAVVIPNGVDTGVFRPRASEPIPHSTIWAGRYVAEKGLAYLLEAAKIVTTKFPDAKFYLMGYGEERPRLIALRRQLKLEDNVILVSPSSQEEIVALLNKCTLFALPSLSEGFPLAVLEDMSCGKPVVVTSGIGLEEVVGDAGIYAQAGDSHELADAIMTILGDQRLGGSLGRRGRERATRYYDWRNVVSEVNDLFEKAIEERRV